MASDSSGQHLQSPFEVLGILIMDLDASLRWEAARQELRRGILKDSRRMAFKKLGEPVRRRALVPFLRSADLIQGLCLSVAIHKSITFLEGPPEMRTQLTGMGTLKADWKSASFERMTTTAHIIGLLLGGLAAAGQNITWISDEDEMFESASKSEDTRRILSAFSSMYVTCELGILRLATTKVDEGDRFEEDLPAIADLAVGAWSEALAKLHKETGGHITGSIAPTLSDQLSTKADLLLSWFDDDSHPLKRVALIFDRRADGKFGVGRLWSETMTTRSPGCIR